MRTRGYPIGGNLIVRCRRGHLFTTLWIPGAGVEGAPSGLGEIPMVPSGPSLGFGDSGEGLGTVSH
jgi:hypothetical protein